MANQYTGRDTMRYSGYANRSTWCIQLWMDNEYDYYKEYFDLVTMAAKNDSIEQAWEWAKPLYRRLWEHHARQDACVWSHLNWAELRANFDDAVEDAKRYGS